MRRVTLCIVNYKNKCARDNRCTYIFYFNSLCHECIESCHILSNYLLQFHRFILFFILSITITMGIVNKIDDNKSKASVKYPVLILNNL